MSFLAPLFLLGALAVALPFWLHRLQAQSSDRKPFASAMLLETTEQQVHVQKKLKYLLLLALRVALLLMIAAVFSRPLWTRPDALPGPGPEGTHLLLVDTSASMGRDGVFDQSISQALAAIEAAPGGAMLQVLSADDALRIESSVSRDRAAHTQVLQSLRPGTSRLEFGRIMAAVERLAESLPQPVTLHIFSDFQDSGMPVRFAELVASRIATFVPHQPTVEAAFNWRTEFVRETAAGVDIGIRAAGNDAMATPIELRLNGDVVGQREIQGSGAAVVSFADLPLESGDNRLQVIINADDELEIDNTFVHVIRNQPPAAIVLLTLNPDGLPVTYLTAALQSDPNGAYRVEPAIIGDFDTRTLGRYSWLIVDDIGSIGPDLEAALVEFVDSGGGLLAFAGQRSATATRLPVFTNSVGAASVGLANDRFLTIGQVDTGHPLLSATDGWYTVNLSQTIPVTAQPDDQVLIRLENDEPFVLERRLGQGRMLLVAGGLENQWNDFPIRPVFVSFVVEAARYLSGKDQLRQSFAAGATLPLSLAGGASGQVVDPDGRTVLSLADTTRAQQIQLDKTGFYEVYTSQGDYVVAVNVDPRESELTAIDGDTLQRWVEAMGSDFDTVMAAAIEQPVEPLELWHGLLFILMLVLIGESVLANQHLAPRIHGGAN